MVFASPMSLTKNLSKIRIETQSPFKNIFFVLFGFFCVWNGFLYPVSEKHQKIVFWKNSFGYFALSKLKCRE